MIQALSRGCYQGRTVIPGGRLRNGNHECLVSRGASMSHSRHNGVVRVVFDAGKSAGLIARGPAQHLPNRSVGVLSQQIEHGHIERGERGERNRQAAANALEAARFAPRDHGA